VSDEEYPDGRRVWPRRNAGPRPEAHAKYISTLLARLAELEQKTRPDGGTSTAAEKDGAAFDALRFAGQLVEAVAGWAIDHQVGLAAEGLKFIPSQPEATKSHKQYLAARSAVDSHEHEKIGGTAKLDKADPFFARKCLANLLQANPGGLPSWLCSLAINGLEALDYGEVTPMFAPVRTGLKRGLTEKRLMLRAIALVAYRRARGFTKEAALAEVADALSLSPDTIGSWERRLRNEFGDLEVARTIAFARNHALWMNEAARKKRKGEEILDVGVHGAAYDDAALEALAEQYRAAISG